MATCISCKKEVPSVNDSGYCPSCARIAMKVELSKRPITAPQTKSPTKNKAEPIPRQVNITMSRSHNGPDGYYEYEVLEYSSGIVGVNTAAIDSDISERGREGWHVVSSFSTRVDEDEYQIVIIMERYKKYF